MWQLKCVIKKLIYLIYKIIKNYGCGFSYLKLDSFNVMNVFNEANYIQNCLTPPSSKCQ